MLVFVKVADPIDDEDDGLIRSAMDNLRNKIHGESTFPFALSFLKKEIRRDLLVICSSMSWSTSLLFRLWLTSYQWFLKPAGQLPLRKNWIRDLLLGHLNIGA